MFIPKAADSGFLVQAQWLTGIGCPTNARLATPNADFTDWTGSYTPYTDPACPTATSPIDQKNTGLLLAKTGPTIENFASAVDIKGVEGMTLTELGYDIRKPGMTFSDGKFNLATIPPRRAEARGAGAEKLPQYA